MEEKVAAFRKLLEIMDELRSKCPWDKKQTLESIRYLTIEETYELSESILQKDMEGNQERTWRPYVTSGFLFKNRF